MTASNMPQPQAHVSQPLPDWSLDLAVDFEKPDLAFLDDTRDADSPRHASSARMPRQILTLAVIAVSVAIWGIIIAIVVSLI